MVVRGVRNFNMLLRSSKELNLQVEDMVDLLTLINRAVANIHLDFQQRKAYRKCSFVGSDVWLDGPN